MACPNLPQEGDPGAIEAGTSGPGCLFVAERGGGARQLPLDGSGDDGGRPIAAAAPRSVAEARYAESVEAAHSDQSEAGRIAPALGITSEPLRLDSQTKYAVVARGDASIYLRLPRGGYARTSGTTLRAHSS